jgi:hypothetical protein
MSKGKKAMMIHRSALRLVAAAALLAAPYAAAQTSGTAPPERNPTDQNAPQHFDSQGRKQNDQTLSERLDRTDGVIRPPAHVDPQMQQAPPPSADREMVKPPPTDQPKPQ